MVTTNTFDYKRTITHTSYKHGDKKVKKGGFSRVLPHKITHDKHKISKDLDPNEKYSLPNDVYFELDPEAHLVPIMVGGTLLVLFLFSFILFISYDEEASIGFIIAMISFFLGFLFYLIYYFTMPKKECIFNRADGLVTFPGIMWHKTITMPVKDIMFSISSPSGGTGAFQLDIVRPDKTYSLYRCNLGNNCYEDLSYFLWYMDKNRPLPRGTAFDKYRDQDFKRRKNARFPKPLFPSDIETPEATPEQQAEREHISGW